MGCPPSSQAKTSDNKLTLYIQELRAPFLTASILPMALGAALAYRQTGEVSPLLLALTLLCGALIHLAANTFNDYFDFKSGCDSNKVTRTPFSGGSGLLPGEHLSAGEVLALSSALLLLAFLAGVAVLFLSPGNAWVILALGITSVLLGYEYTAPPLRLAYRGAGEIAIFIAFGPVPVTAACYIMGGELGITPLAASVPPGLMTTAIIWINQFPDYETDKMAEKRNLLIRMGREKGRSVYYALVLLAGFSLVGHTWWGITPKWSIIGLAYLLAALPAAFILSKEFDNTSKLVPAMRLTIASQTLLTLLMIAGALL